MLVLGIETSTPQASVAIGSEQGLVASALVSRGASYNEFLLPATRFCMEEAGIGYRNLSAIAVDVGPGLFTGMRVGVATAKAMAHTLSLPIIGITSLDLLAYSVRYASKTICAVLDARRGEVFSAFYRSSPGGVQRMTDYRVEKPGQLAIGIASRPEEVLLVGSGALLYREVFDDLGTLIEVGSMGHAFPDAKALVELSLPRLFREDFDSPYHITPLYLRRSARPIQWQSIRGSRSA